MAYENVLSDKKCDYRVYFLGAGGISMSALCLYLNKKGFFVGGYDKEKNDCVKKLENAGIKIDSGRLLTVSNGEIANESVPVGLKNCNAVVYTSALASDDPLLIYARRSGKAVISRAELLAEILKNYRFSIGVSGTHGKTTATLMLCHIFKCANVDFEAHAGGCDNTFGNFVAGKGSNECFISEICEYKRNISLFSPSVAVVLNIDDDHLESYGGFSDLANEFIGFARRSGVCVYNDDDKVLQERLPSECADKAISYSIKNENCDYFARKIKVAGNKITFRAYYRKKDLGDFEINGVLKHNVLNALAAIAAARVYGINVDDIRRGLKEYVGAYRREEKIGEFNGATVFADYCHHPRQIKETVRALEKSGAERVTIVFQPHTFSRTKLLFKKFLSALKTQRARLIITGVYAAREKYDYYGSGRRLAENISNAVFIEKPDSAVKTALAGACSGDVIAFLGAGDIYFAAKKYLDENKKVGL